MVRTDAFIARWIETYNTEPGERVALAISLLGNEALWAILAIVGAWCVLRRAWLPIALLAVGAVGSMTLNSFLKNLIHRGRPIYAIEFSVDASSFPSGHAMNAVVGFGLLAYLVGEHIHHGPARPSVIVAAALVILAVGASRVYLDVHYLSDVLAGFAAGGMWLAVCLTAYAFARRVRVRR
jgi:undecaprenyl-diphosphatase